MAKTNQAYKICRVQSHYLGYQVIAPNFYVIPNGKENFRSLFTGNEDANVIDQMATGLFSLMNSTGKIPYVRVSNGELSEKIFKRLTQLYLKNKEVEQSPSKRQDNPLVIILDRRTDLHTMLYHSWTYLNLIQDIFNIQNNQYQYLEDAKA
jgi:hypothetical protein